MKRRQSIKAKGDTTLYVTIAIIVIVAILFVIFLLTAPFSWPDWTGFGAQTHTAPDFYSPAKTLWGWLVLLIVPLVLACVGIYFAHQSTQLADSLTLQSTRAVNKLARESARQTVLASYLDSMSSLLLNENLATSEAGSAVRTVARVRTLLVLSALGDDGASKGYVVQFLNEAGLRQVPGSPKSTANDPIVDLSGADLSGVDPTAADLKTHTFPARPYKAQSWRRSLDRRHDPRRKSSRGIDRRGLRDFGSAKVARVQRQNGSHRRGRTTKEAGDGPWQSSRPQGGATPSRL